MPRVREQIVADLMNQYEPTEYETAQNRFELACNSCGRVSYVDGATLAAHEKAIAYDLDNQFICAECKSEYEDLVFE